jgi:hypothetical protein
MERGHGVFGWRARFRGVVFGFERV